MSNQLTLNVTYVDCYLVLDRPYIYTPRRQLSNILLNCHLCNVPYTNILGRGKFFCYDALICKWLYCCICFLYPHINSTYVFDLLIYCLSTKCFRIESVSLNLSCCIWYTTHCTKEGAGYYMMHEIVVD